MENDVTNLLRWFIEYPKGSLLFLVAFLNSIFILYFFVFKKGFKKNIYRAYFVYGMFSVVWVAINGYFQSPFLVQFGPNFAKLMALMANLSVNCSLIGFYYISSAIKDQKVSIYSWVLMVFLWVMAFFFNSVPNLTIKEVLIFEDGTFEIIQGVGTGIYFFMGVIVILLSIANFFLAARRNRIPNKNTRILYILFSMGMMYLSLIVFLLVLPFYFQNYSYAWIPPLMSIFEVLTVGYAIMTERFLGTWTVILRFLKILLASLTAILAASWGANIIFKGLYFLFFFYIAYKFLNSRLFYNYFGGTESEGIVYITRDFEESQTHYETSKEFERELRNIFTQMKIKMIPKIIEIDADFKKNYPVLLEYFESHTTPLIAEELRFKNGSTAKENSLLKELESLGDLCLSLLNDSKKPIGIIAFTHQNSKHLYKKEELDGLEDLRVFASKIIA